MPTRRQVLAGLAAAAAGTAPGCAQAPAATAQPALDALIARLAYAAEPDQDYRPPDDDERDAVPAALDRLIRGDAGRGATEEFDRLGMDVTAGTDTVTGRRYVLAASRRDTERSWGAVVLDPSGPPTVLVEVPHLVADRDTETLGLELYRAVPGAVLLVAGAHRRADGERADVAHQPRSFFHAAAVHLGERGVPELQLHGFDTDSLPDVDSVVSPGAGEVAPLTVRVADELAAAGLTVCRAWDGDDCGSLEGRTNSQGRAAAEGNRPFVHIELSPRRREPGEPRDAVVRALARAVQLRAQG